MKTELYKFYRSYSASTVTFPLWNLSGQFTGYQQYRPSKHFKRTNHPKFARYYTYLPKHVDGLFGLEQLDESKDTIFIVEGIFKAAVLHSDGFNALAVLGATPKRLKPLFRILRRRYRLIAIGDNDEAGRKLVSCVGCGKTSEADLDEMDKDRRLSFVLTLLKETL